MADATILSLTGMLVVGSVLHHAVWRGVNHTMIKIGMVVVGFMAGVSLDVAKALLPLVGVGG